MKKLIIIVFVILSLPSSGQSNILDIGIEGGITSASLRGNEILDDFYKSRTGHSAGLFIQYNFSKLFSLRTGAYMEKKGASAEFLVTDEFGNSNITVHEMQNFDYLAVPVLLRAGVGKKVRVFVNAGPYIGFLLKQTVEWEELPQFTGDNTRTFKSTEFGLSAGAGISFNLFPKFSISLEARDNFGISDISRSNNYFHGLAVKTNALNFLLGIALKIG